VPSSINGGRNARIWVTFSGMRVEYTIHDWALRERRERLPCAPVVPLGVLRHFVKEVTVFQNGDDGFVSLLG